MSVPPVTLPPSGNLNYPNMRGGSADLFRSASATPEQMLAEVRSYSEPNVKRLKPLKSPSTLSEPIMKIHSPENAGFNEMVETIIRARAMAYTNYILQYLASVAPIPTRTTIEDLYSRYPHLATMDSHAIEKID